MVDGNVWWQITEAPSRLQQQPVHITFGSWCVFPVPAVQKNNEDCQEVYHEGWQEGILWKQESEENTVGVPEVLNIYMQFINGTTACMYISL